MCSAHGGNGGERYGAGGPKTPQTAKDEGPPASKQELQAAFRAINITLASEAGMYFAAPADPEEAPDYDKIVKNPIDLGEIANRLRERKYSSIGA